MIAAALNSRKTATLGVAASPTCSQMAGCELLISARLTLPSRATRLRETHDMTDESSLIVRTRCALCWQRIQPDETRTWTCADGMLLDICELCNELLLARLISRC